MAVYATALKHFLYGVESAFGSPAAASGVQDVSALTMIPAAVDDGSFERVGGLTLLEDNTVRVGHAPLPGIPDSAYSSGASKYLDRGRGDVSVSFQVRNFGTGSTNVTSSADTFLAAALATILSASTAGSASVTVTGAGANAGSAQVSAALDVGEVVMVVQNGRVYTNRVTAYSTPGVTFLHYFPTALANGTVIYRGTTLSCGTGVETETYGPSLALELASRSGKTIATGCRLRTATFTLDSSDESGGRLMCALTFAAAYLVQVEGPIAVLPPEMPAASWVATQHLAAPRYGTAVTGTTAGASVTAGDLRFLGGSWTLTIEAELTPVSPGSGHDLVSMAEMAVTGRTCTVAFEAHNINTVVGNDYRSMAKRSWAFPFGPVLAGNGIGLVLPAAVFTEDPNVHTINGQPLAVQPYAIVASEYSGDDPAGDPADNADFALLLVGV